MRLGDIIESGIWVTGDEPESMRKWYEGQVSEAMCYLASEQGFNLGPVMFTEKHPMDDRVPEVPDHIQGSRVRLLVGEAVVESVIDRGSFIANLEYEDLQRLRTITRKKAGRPLQDWEADQVIDMLGPDAALDTMRH